MICCGTKDSVVGKYPLSYHEIFDRNGVSHLWYEFPDADHDSNAIRSGLFNFLIRLFADKYAINDTKKYSYGRIKMYI